MSDLVSSRIHLLPEHLVDQIKAGEVIERPANLIKEILENSLDAEAKNISIHLVGGGMELIALEDDGRGMSFADLPYAFCRHATSKIDKFEDLYNLGSYGFRGEALASIASIARVTCVSHPSDPAIAGGRIVINAGETQSHQSLESDQQGTSLFIKDLFYNTPARLKFIKSMTSEKNALRRTLLSFILTHPDTSFSIKWDDEDKKIYPTFATSSETREKRISELFSGKGKDNYFHFEKEYESHKVSGYLSKTSTKGSSYKKHFLFVNGRLFTDRQIHQTILRSMERLYPQGESGHYVVFLTVPPNLIDVNVHPHKTLIKFFKMPVITGLLSSEIKGLKSDSQNHELQLSPSPSYQIQEKSFEQSADDFQNEQNSFSFGNFSSASTPLAPKVIKTPSYLSILAFKGRAFLLRKDALIATLQIHLKEHSGENNDFIPLLITEPFNYLGNLKEAQEKLKDWGLECDINLEDNLILLRSYNPLHQLDFIKQLIPLLIESRFSISQKLVEEIDFNEALLSSFLDIESISRSSTSFMKEIDENLCNLIFD